MWVKQSHKPSPSHHFYSWYICLPLPVMGGKHGIVWPTQNGFRCGTTRCGPWGPSKLCRMPGQTARSEVDCVGCCGAAACHWRWTSPGRRFGPCWSVFRWGDGKESKNAGLNVWKACVKCGVFLVYHRVRVCDMFDMFIFVAWFSISWNMSITLFAGENGTLPRDGDHFGMFPVFVLGNVLSLPTGILLVSRLGPAVLSKHYALMTAPSCVPWSPWIPWPGHVPGFSWRVTP